MSQTQTPENQLLLAVVAMAVGMSLIPVGDAIAKYISGVAPYSAGFLAWSRFVVGGFVLIPIAFLSKSFHGLGKAFYLRQALRGFLIAMTLILIITAVSLSPLADVFGAFFIGPVIATLLSVFILKERASRLDWITVLLGFIGVLLVIQPGMGDESFLSQGLLYALAAGVFYGSFLTATRWAAGLGPPLAQLTAQLMFGMVFIAPLGIIELLDHGIQSPGPVLIMGITSAGANFLSIIALARARAAYLAPVVYLQIIVATLISWLLFGDALNTLAIAGLVLIVVTGLLKIQRPKHKP